MSSVKQLAMLVILVMLVAVQVRAAEKPTSDEPEPEKRTVRMDVEEWKWIPDIVRVREGTTVVLKIHSFDASHRFDLKAYGLKVPLPQDKLTKVEFVADKPGEFSWRCGRPCGNGCPKMRGKLIVLEAQPDDGAEAEPGS